MRVYGNNCYSLNQPLGENIVFQHAGQLLAGGTFTSTNNSAAYTIYWPHNGTNAYQYWQFSNPWVIRDGETKKFYSPSYSTSTGVTTFKQLDLFANMSFSANSYSNRIGDIGTQPTGMAVVVYLT